jgi:hypothetical protein
MATSVKEKTKLLKTKKNPTKRTNTFSTTVQTPVLTKIARSYVAQNNEKTTQELARSPKLAVYTFGQIAAMKAWSNENTPLFSRLLEHKDPFAHYMDGHVKALKKAKTFFNLLRKAIVK